ncbi:hypothetical protein MTO96_051616 [Rhipicephalus appendiculatus]
MLEVGDHRRTHKAIEHEAAKECMDSHSDYTNELLSICTADTEIKIFITMVEVICRAPSCSNSGASNSEAEIFGLLAEEEGAIEGLRKPGHSQKPSMAEAPDDNGSIVQATEGCIDFGMSCVSVIYLQDFGVSRGLGAKSIPMSAA